MIEVLECEMLPAVHVAPVPPPTTLLHARMAALIHGIRTELEPVECPVEHFFSQGLYSRVMHIPAGAVVVGKIHKTVNQLTMLAGEALIVAEDGIAQRVRAPRLWVSPPGVQRSVVAITDCLFMSSHATPLTDVAEIEKEFIAQDALEYQEHLRINYEET